MSGSSSGVLTELLARARHGDHVAASQVAASVNDELRQIAAGLFAGERRGHVLQPTAIVNEAWLRLIGPDGRLAVPDLASRGHFYAIAATAMRNSLVDYARQHQAMKREGDRVRIMLEDRDAGSNSEAFEVLAVNEAVEKLQSQLPRAARVVELRYFCSATIEETAAALDVSPETVKKDWRFAKAFLERELREHG